MHIQSSAQNKSTTSPTQGSYYIFEFEKNDDFIMRLNKLNVAILGISVAGPVRAADEVVEYRQFLETWVQPLEKRDITCTGSAEGK